MPKTLHKEMKITVCSLSKNKNDKPDWIYEITENGEITIKRFDGSSLDVKIKPHFELYSIKHGSCKRIFLTLTRNFFGTKQILGKYCKWFDHKEKKQKEIIIYDVGFITAP